MINYCPPPPDQNPVFAPERGAMWGEEYKMEMEGK